MSFPRENHKEFLQEMFHAYFPVKTKSAAVGLVRFCELDPRTCYGRRADLLQVTKCIDCNKSVLRYYVR